MTHKIILENYQAPGDIVVLTAALRDLHLCHPGEFVTDVRTICPELWDHNVSPVSFLIHLAAAVPTKPGAPACRPCVVILGGREPAHWVSYPQHQVLHTNGALRCCANGGCWKARTVALGDHHEKDSPELLCEDVVDGPLPRCMDMIKADDVIRRIELYFEGGAISYLSA